MRWQWHQLYHMQIICTSVQTNNHTNTSSLNFLHIIVLSHWPHVATHVATQVAELVAELVFAMYFNGTIHTSNKLLDLCPRMLLEPFTLATCHHTSCRHIFVLMTSSVRCCYAPRRLVAAHVASVKAL